MLFCSLTALDGLLVGEIDVDGILEVLEDSSLSCELLVGACVLLATEEMCVLVSLTALEDVTLLCELLDTDGLLVGGIDVGELLETLEYSSLPCELDS